MDIIPEIGFVGYALIAIILTLLYIVTAIEVLILLFNKSVDGNIKELRRASNYIFAGIILTLAAGCAAQNTLLSYDDFLIAIPLFFMIYWAIWYVKYSRVTEDFIELKAQIEQFHLKAIRKALKEAIELKGQYGGNGAVDEEGFANAVAIFELSRPHLELPSALDSLSGVAQKIVPLSGQQFFTMFQFNPQKVEDLLRKMKNNGESWLATKATREGNFFRLNSAALS